MTSQRAVVATGHTGADGRFALPAIEPGSYLVVARAPGLDERQAGVDVTAGATASIEMALAMAGIRETVSVTASPGSARDVAHRAGRQRHPARRHRAARRRWYSAGLQRRDRRALQRTSPTMAGVFVRGLTGNKVNVFVDGVRYSNGAQRGGVNTFLDLIDPVVSRGRSKCCAARTAPSTAATRSAAASSSCRRCPALWTGAGTRLGGQVDVRGVHRPPRRRRHRVRIDVARPPSALFGTFAAQSHGRRPRRRRPRLPRGGDALLRRHRPTALCRPAARYRVPSVRRHAEGQLDAERRTPASCQSYIGHAPGRRQPLRPAARRRRQPDRGAATT